MYKKADEGPKGPKRIAYVEAHTCVRGTFIEITPIFFVVSGSVEHGFFFVLLIIVCLLHTQ